MGLADRDYMRVRHREARGFRDTSWNDKKGRLEDGSWFEAKNRGHDYRISHRRLGVGSRGGVWSLVGPWISILSLGAVALWAVERYSPVAVERATRSPIDFPGTGDVYVTPFADMSGEQSTFGVRVPSDDSRNYVVLLHDVQLGRDVLGVFVRSGESTRVPVPAGRYRVRAASGTDWFGMEDLFGVRTRVEEVRDIMEATPKLGTGIAFTRRIDGDLPTDPRWRTEFLDRRSEVK